MNCKICDKSFTGLVCFQQHEASEKHKNKLKLYQMRISNSATQEASTNIGNLQIIPCTVCEINLTGLLNFQAHVNSIEHADMVKKKTSKNNSLDDQSEFIAKGPIIADQSNQQDNQINSAFDIPLNRPTMALNSYAQCETCQKQFSGPEPYQQHLDSAAHKKKSIQKGLNVVPEDPPCFTKEPVIAEINSQINPGFEFPLNRPSVASSSYPQCEICQKIFTGPEPYQQHLVSTAHKKKAIQKGLIVVMGDQSLCTSEESVIAEANNQASARSYTLLNPSNVPYAQCEICQKQFSGAEPYQQHLDSAAHKKKSIQKELSSNKLNFDTVDSDRIMPFFKPQEMKVINDGASATTNPYAECAICNMQFSGPAPYQLHLDSIGHQKKIAIQPNLSIQAGENTKQFGSSLRCDVCDKDFSGPIPFEDHMKSDTHKRKVQNVEILINFKSTLPVEPDYITKGIKNNVGPPGINREWYCEVCKKQTTGPEPYQQHVFGATHIKNVRAAENECNVERLRGAALQKYIANTKESQNDISKANELKSNLNKFNIGDKPKESSKDFYISNDLILCNAFENISAVRPEDLLNITVFYPDDEIVFDNTVKKNANIISELNYE